MGQVIDIQQAGPTLAQWRAALLCRDAEWVSRHSIRMSRLTADERQTLRALLLDELAALDAEDEHV